MTSNKKLRNKLSLLFAAVFAFVSLGLAPAYAVDVRLLDVVEVTWNGAPAPVANAAAIAKVIDTEVNADWRAFTTMYGDTKDRTVSFNSGQVLTTPIVLNSKMVCSGALASDFMNSIRPQAYRRLGIADYSSRYLVVVAPKAGCVWSGRAQLGDADSKSGTLILHETASSFVITHELGHTFGLGHTNFLRCENEANDGPWGQSCLGVEYGGTIDVMGNVPTKSPLSTYHQWRMGYMDDSQIKQVWQSEVVNISPSDFANGTKAIFIRDGKAAYWIEYRRKTDGVGYKPGLAIYRLDPPPISALVSPNPEDSAASEFPEVLGIDLWMLNLDTYQYRDTRRVSGSMTGLKATTYSGNVSFSAVASETGAVVTITKKADTTAPAAPPVVPAEQWVSPDMVILTSGYEDGETAIASFESQINGVIAPLKATDVQGWLPTYLSPFVAPKTVYLRDLPEGSYAFSMRAIDVAGNKSEWSKPMDVVIDRADPVVTNSFVVASANSSELTLSWKGATDSGSGICQASIVDEDGLIIQSSTAKNAPAFKLPAGSTLSGTAQVFDCLGNGLTGELNITNTYVPANKTIRTGKWSSAASNFGPGALRCTSNCTASVTAKGRFEVLLGSGSANVTIGKKVVASINQSKNKSLMLRSTVDLGPRNKVMRVTGSNFVLVGLASVTTTLGALEEIDRGLPVADTSLEDAKQIALSKYGFRTDDFSPEWTVLPMVRGTTLLDPSLDLCNGSYASEKNRLERRQVIATKTGSSFAFLSTEVVKYSSAAAASAAQKELVKVLAQCQVDGGYTDTTGAKVEYAFKDLTKIPLGVVSEENRVFVHAVMNTGDAAQTLLGFYQFNGDTFTGLYVINKEGFTEAQVAKWLKIAATMGERLQGSAF